MSSERAVRIQGIGVYYPQDEGERALDFARHATTKALERAGLKSSQVDSVVLCTRALCEESLEGAEAVRSMLAKLGLPADGVATVKLLESCAGGLRGLQLAVQAMRGAGAHHPLVIGMDPRFDAATGERFSCGAAAMVLGFDGGEQGGPLASFFCDPVEAHDGNFERIECPAGEECPGREGVFQITAAGEGPAAPRGWVGALGQAIEGVLDRAGLTLQDVNHCAFHQMGADDQRWYEALGISETQMVQLAAESAYLGCSVFTSLAAAVDAGRVAAGDLVLLSSIAPGAKWEAMIWRW